jgi:hypothetical protein
VTFGIAAAITTAIMNGLSALTRPSDICQPNTPLFSALGLLIFLGLAAVAGWRTTRSGQAASAAALSGLLVGAISGIVVIVVVLLSLGNAERAASCLATSSTPAAAARVLRFAAVVFGFVLALLGIGVGAGTAALGGLVGERRQTA